MSQQQAKSKLDVLREFFNKDAMLERATHPDYTLIVLLGGVIIGFGFFIWIEMTVMESLYTGVSKPTWYFIVQVVLLAVAVLVLVVVYVLVRSWIIQYRDDMDMQQVEPLYPNDDFVEIIDKEENGKRTKIDPLEVTEKRYHGVDEQHDVNLTDEEIEKILQEPDKGSTPEITALEDKIPGATQKGNAPVPNGRKYCLTYYKYITPLSYRVKEAARGKDGKLLHQDHHDKEIYIVFPAPHKEALQYGRMQIPNGGMGIPHGHCAKIKIRFIRLLGGACGPKPLYFCTSCAYYDKMDPRELKDRMKLDQVGVLEASNRALVHSTKRQQLKMECDQQALMDIQSANKEDMNLRKKNVISSLANKALLEKEFDDARRKVRFSPRKEDLPAYLVGTITGWVLAVILLFMLFQKM